MLNWLFPWPNNQTCEVTLISVNHNCMEVHIFIDRKGPCTLYVNGSWVVDLTQINSANFYELTFAPLCLTRYYRNVDLDWTASSHEISLWNQRAGLKCMAYLLKVQRHIKAQLIWIVFLFTDPPSLRKHHLPKNVTTCWNKTGKQSIGNILKQSTSLVFREIISRLNIW